MSLELTFVTSPRTKRTREELSHRLRAAARWRASLSIPADVSKPAGPEEALP